MPPAVRVLLVDDSAFVRFSLRRRLSADPAIEIVDEARDGIEAVEKALSLRPDVITMDVEMPRLDGLEALTQIMAHCPTHVIMLSSLTLAGADVTLEALHRGAVDFVAKPAGPATTGIADLIDELLPKIKAAAGARLRLSSGHRLVTPNPTTASPRPPRVEPLPARSSAPRQPHRAGLVVIGSSTGGPRALTEVVPRFPASFPAAVVVVQHMPAGFTHALALRLNEASQIRVKEAEEGDRVRPGVALLAPGGRHLRIAKGGVVALTEDPPRNGVRPAVDTTMETAADVYGPATVGVVLTGMGNDGTAGSVAVKRVGGRVIAEDPSTCVVYGMPRSAIDAGVVDVVVPLYEIVDELIRLV